MLSQQFRQHGAALIIGLIFLVLLSIIGLGSMRNVTLQERITGNSVDSYRAYNNADIALLEAEEAVSQVDFVTTNLYLNTQNDGVSHAVSTLWENCGDPAQVAENLCDVQGSGARVKYETKTQNDVYVITVWASGAANANVMLQSVFEGKFKLQD